MRAMRVIDSTLWVAVRKSHQPLATSGMMTYAPAVGVFALRWAPRRRQCRWWQRLFVRSVSGAARPEWGGWASGLDR